jgi:hypothetical protein
MADASSAVPPSPLVRGLFYIRYWETGVSLRFTPGFILSALRA